MIIPISQIRRDWRWMPSGSLYVADTDNCRVQKFSKKGKFTKISVLRVNVILQVMFTFQWSFRRGGGCQGECLYFHLEPQY